ncbi:sulfotransferase 1C3-like isoform X1 [Bombyx mandarina]|uniref:Sulfotransferase 1C3-like isoform X1 n=2 Tax=Bombyx mandarina TaxID=7092 RepID=A0A6J2JJG9_BOMMA|nr:sulfotransferase 1C3-like isoform X1 [Bombyx mandarina]
MASNRNCPEIRENGEEESTELRRLFKGLENCPGFVRVGPAGYLFSVAFEPEIKSIYNMEVRATDIIYVATFPRSGTTWTQEMVWLLLNDLDYAKAASLNLVDRYINVGISIWGLASRAKGAKILKFKEEDKRKYKQIITPGCELLAAASDPRFIKTHLPMCMLPPNLIETAKIVYVARDPRDVVVSLYHFYRLMPVPQFTGDFKTFWNMFVRDNVIRTPYFAHIKEAWELRNHPNMLFLFYEELKNDLSNTIKRTAKFFNKEYTDEQISVLCNHLNINNFRHNDSVSLNFLADVFIPGEEPFIRKGKVGGWRDYFDDEMTVECEQWMAKKLKETGIRFPVFSNDVTKK